MFSESTVWSEVVFAAEKAPTDKTVGKATAAEKAAQAKSSSSTLLL